MTIERWVVLAKVSGDFVIPDRAVSAVSSADQALRKLEVTPEFDGDGNYSGQHALTAEIDVVNETDLPLPGNVPLEEGKEIVEGIAAAISLAIGRPVKVVSVSVRHDLPEPRKHRLVAGACQAVSIAPPSHLDPTLLTVPIDRKARRVIRWWARGIAAADGVERLMSLTSALDLLASDYDVGSTRIRKCKECGHEEIIGPGLRERELAYLTGELGYAEEVATSIYESRIDLAHARSDLNQDDLRRFREHASLLADAIRTGLGRRLGVTLASVPQSLPFDLPSALLDIQYEDPDETAGPV